MVAGRQAGRQAGWQAVKQAGRQAMASRQAGLVSYQRVDRSDDGAGPEIGADTTAVGTISLSHYLTLAPGTV